MTDAANQDPFGLSTLPEKGAPPATRLKDHSSAHAIYKKLLEADDGSRINRARIDGLYDGIPPYSAGALKDQGQIDRTNLNFGGAYSQREDALSAFVSLINTVDYIAQINIDYPDKNRNFDLTDIVSRAFHESVVDEWDSFHPTFYQLCKQFTTHGIGLGWHEDDKNWQFRASGLENFLIPRETPAMQTAIEIAVISAGYYAGELYQFIKDPKIAKKAGWNVEQTRQAIIEATPNRNDKNFNWESWERQIKENDLWVSYANSAKIKINHYLVKEFDGKISHSIGRQDGAGEFLFKRIGRFKDSFRVFTIFTYGAQADTYHQIRGQGNQILNFCELENILGGHVIDATVRASTMIVQSDQSEDRSDLDLTVLAGAVTILPPNMTIVANNMANNSRASLEVMNFLSMKRQNYTGSFDARQINPDGQARTATESQLQATREQELSSTAMNFFYVPWGRLLREMFRRISRDDYSENEPGGQQAISFRRKLVEAKVPQDVLKYVKSVKPVRAIGDGSETKRLMKNQALMQLMGQMDELGRNTVARQAISSLGFNADAYIPRLNAASRPPIDVSIAQLENNSLRSSSPINVLPNQQHLIHAEIHISDMIQATQGVDVNNPQAFSLIPYLAKALAHTGEHLGMVGRSGEDPQRVSQIKEAFEEMVKIFNQLMQRAQAQQQEDPGQPAQPMPSAEEVAKVQKFALDMQMKKAQAAQDMQIKGDKAIQTLLIKDNTAARKLRAKDAEEQLA